MKSQLQGVSSRIVTMKSTDAMNRAMAGATRAMAVMNQQMNLPRMQQLMMEFEAQNSKMEMKQEMMDEVINDALDGDEMDAESEDVINQVLDEIGIKLAQDLVDAPSGKAAAAPVRQAIPVAATTAADLPSPPSDSSEEVNDLQARLNRLRK